MYSHCCDPLFFIFHIVVVVFRASSYLWNLILWTWMNGTMVRLYGYSSMRPAYCYSNSLCLTFPLMCRHPHTYTLFLFIYFRLFSFCVSLHVNSFFVLFCHSISSYPFSRTNHFRLIFRVLYVPEFIFYLYSKQYWHTLGMYTNKQTLYWWTNKNIFNFYSHFDVMKIISY